MTNTELFSNGPVGERSRPGADFFRFTGEMIALKYIRQRRGSGDRGVIGAKLGY